MNIYEGFFLKKSLFSFYQFKLFKLRHPIDGLVHAPFLQLIKGQVLKKRIRETDSFRTWFASTMILAPGPTSPLRMPRRRRSSDRSTPTWFFFITNLNVTKEMDWSGVALLYLEFESVESLLGESPGQCSGKFKCWLFIFSNLLQFTIIPDFFVAIAKPSDLRRDKTNIFSVSFASRAVEVR